MRALFPNDMSDLQQSASVFRGRSDIQQCLTSYDYFTGEQTLDFKDEGEKNLAKHFARVNRSLFREWLSSNLNISWDKKFTHYEEHERGVTAFFADGTSAEGDILVASDGSHSKVRLQMVGAEAAEPKYVPIGVVGAELRLNKEQYRKQIELGSSFRITSGAEHRFFISPKEFAADGESAEYYWLFFFKDSRVPQEQRNYWTQTAGQQEQLDFALKESVDMHPIFREVIENTKIEDVTPSGLLLLEWIPREDTLPGSKVTLIGDALHTVSPAPGGPTCSETDNHLQMTPFRGAGANTAILDALDMAQMLIHAQANDLDFSSVIKPYEKVAIPRGKEMTKGSHETSVARPQDWVKNMKARLDVGYAWKPIEEWESRSAATSSPVAA